MGRGRGPQRRLHFGEVGGPVTLDPGALDLGDYTVPPALSLKAARDVARALLGLAARGIDPLSALEAADRATQERAAAAERRRTQRTQKLGSLLDRFIEERERGTRRSPALRPSTIVGWRGLANGALGPLRDRDPATLTASDIRQFHESVGATGRMVTANRSLELLKVLYGWAMRSLGDDGEPLLDATPCAGVKAFPERPRTRLLDSAELRAVWFALDGERYGDTLRLLIWTGARKGEALGAEWGEVDFQARLWRVPAARSKTKEPRTIPLSLPAVEMLSGRRDSDREGRWVFPSAIRGAGPVRSIQSMVRRVQETSTVKDWTVHDLRRVLRTNLAALGVTVPVAEFILGHLPPKIVRTYDRHEPISEAAAALNAWARRLDSYVTGKAEDGTVVPFSR